MAAKAARTALEELIEISRAVGRDADLVQGGGGNTSVKSRDGLTMHVKASGAPLAEVDETRGWAEVDLDAVRAIVDDGRLGRLASARREASAAQRLLDAVVAVPEGVESPEAARPSVETCLHALLDRVVIHTHPVGLNAFLSTERSGSRFEALLGSIAGTPLYVPYADPGVTLARHVARDLATYREVHGAAPSVVLLENHGLFVSAGSVADAIGITRKVVSAAADWAKVDGSQIPFSIEPADGEAAPGADGAPELRGALLRAGCSPGVLRRDSTSGAQRLARKKELLAYARKGAFTPDHILYCGTHALTLDGSRPASWERSIAAHRARHGEDPRVIIVSGDSVWYAAENLEQLRVVAEMYRAAIVALLLGRRAGGLRFLSKRQARFVESWDVPTFRSRLDSERGKPLLGRVAVVTGAASGLGKGIALGLIGAGATVVACDVDQGGLAEVAAEQPTARYLPTFCDVTDEDSVATAFGSAVSMVGGIDFLVNAAGIAPSFQLVDFPLRAWQKTLDINLTGYFLTAREAARVLLRQGAGGGIVNLTSKSGLEASKSNSAYNATKAGEIHLMRGWALELGPAGVRVNCVAPGNVFKGSKIWNDEYIRMAAKKKGIRPEEVIPYYTSLSPLAKEIEPEDIANAIIWLLSDAARRVTGQTVVVDGGQVMVR